MQGLTHARRLVIAAVLVTVIVAIGVVTFEVHLPVASDPSTSVIHSSTVTPLTSTYVNGSTGLSLRLTVNSTALMVGQNLSVSVSEYNSANAPNNVTIADQWPIANLTLDSCAHQDAFPFGVAVLRGNYDQGNVSSGTTLQTVEGGLASCPPSPSFNSYFFEPHSDMAALSGGCASSTSVTTTESNGTAEVFAVPSDACGPLYISLTIAIAGTWTGGVPVPLGALTPSVIHPLQSGEYTLVGGDEWGDEAILHFVVDA